MEIQEFGNQLKQQLEHIANPRPFVCQGTPLACDIFIVGFNAATAMQAPFSDFWHDQNGFDKEAWLQAYIAERAAMPLKPGKTRRNKISNTRQRIEWIISQFDASKCLETNLYMTATAQADELKKQHKLDSTFLFLLRTIKPKVLLTHGAEAKKALEEITGQTLIADTPNTATVNAVPVVIFPVSHLSRGWSKQACFELGKKLQALALPE